MLHGRASQRGKNMTRLLVFVKLQKALEFMYGRGEDGGGLWVSVASQETFFKLPIYIELYTLHAKNILAVDDENLWNLLILFWRAEKILIYN